MLRHSGYMSPSVRRPLPFHLQGGPLCYRVGLIKPSLPLGALRNEERKVLVECGVGLLVIKTITPWRIDRPRCWLPALTLSWGMTNIALIVLKCLPCCLWLSRCEPPQPSSTPADCVMATVVFFFSFSEASYQLPNENVCIGDDQIPTLLRLFPPAASPPEHYN